MSTPVRLALLDYGAGNLASVQKALAHVGFTVVRATTAPQTADAGALVIPGVGHYSTTRALMQEFGSTVRSAFANEMPVLGICLGLQVLFDGSDEAPQEAGFGVFPGRCVRLTGEVKVPHVGWNQVGVARSSRLLAGIDSGQVYFTHSYAAPVDDAAVGVTTHGSPFASVVERGSIFAVQWHPEKSAETGLAVLRNFRDICAAC